MVDDGIPWDRDDGRRGYIEPGGMMEGLTVGQHSRGVEYRRGLGRPERVRPITTPGQKRKFKRNVVIAAAARQGCSERMLAEVFGIARSRIAAILDEMESSL